MALSWGTTANNANGFDLGTVDCGQSTDMSVASWVYPIYVSGTNPRGIVIQKGAGGANNQRWFWYLTQGGGASSWGYRLSRNYTTTNMIAQTNADSAEVIDSQWNFLAATHQDGGNSGVLYYGDETTAAAVATNDTDVPDAGTLRTSAQNTGFGYDAQVGNAGFTGYIAFTAIFTSALSQAAIQAIQFNPIVGSLARSDLQALWVPGLHGTGNAYDMSGTGFNSSGASGLSVVLQNPVVVGRFPRLGASPHPYAVAASGDVLFRNQIDAIRHGQVANTAATLNGVLVA